MNEVDYEFLMTRFHNFSAELGYAFVAYRARLNFEENLKDTFESLPFNEKKIFFRGPSSRKLRNNYLDKINQFKGLLKELGCKDSSFLDIFVC